MQSNRSRSDSRSRSSALPGLFISRIINGGGCKNIPAHFPTETFQCHVRFDRESCGMFSKILAIPRNEFFFKIISYASFLSPPPAGSGEKPQSQKFLDDELWGLFQRELCILFITECWVAKGFSTTAYIDSVDNHPLPLDLREKIPLQFCTSSMTDPCLNGVGGGGDDPRVPSGPANAHITEYSCSSAPG